jgi:acetyltransferase-like isoleucine patch superfamily enzyme
VRIEGRRVEIGRMAFLDRGATIGGGSCWDPRAFLLAGDFLHMGVNSHVNTARGVTCGDEVGIGIETKIFTHGAYIDSYALGAPVQFAGVTIGSNVWLPNAWVNPGVTIGSNVVVAARSLINRSVDSGDLVGGVPAQIIKKGAYSGLPSRERQQAVLESVVEDLLVMFRQYARPPSIGLEGTVISIAGHEFDVEARTIRRTGPPIEMAYSVLVVEQLRRYGIRFRFAQRGQEWVPWGNDVMRLDGGA